MRFLLQTHFKIQHFKASQNAHPEAGWGGWDRLGSLPMQDSSAYNSTDIFSNQSTAGYWASPLHMGAWRQLECPGCISSFCEARCLMWTVPASLVGKGTVALRTRWACRRKRRLSDNLSGVGVGIYYRVPAPYAAWNGRANHETKAENKWIVTLCFLRSRAHPGFITKQATLF